MIRGAVAIRLGFISGLILGKAVKCSAMGMCEALPPIQRGPRQVESQPGIIDINNAIIQVRLL